VHAARTFGITLVSPLLLDNSAQARAGAGYDKAAFSVDFVARRATCPQGTASSSWSPCQKNEGEAIVVSWAKKRLHALPRTAAVHQRQAPPGHHPPLRAVRGGRRATHVTGNP
jgi:hypothetical protein